MSSKATLQEAQQKYSEIIQELDILIKTLEDYFDKKTDSINISNQQFFGASNKLNKLCYMVGQDNQVFAQVGQTQTDNIECEEDFFRYFQKKIKDFLQKDQIAINRISEPHKYLKIFAENFQNFCCYTYWMSKMFHPLNQFYTKKMDSTIQNEGFKIYQEIFEQYEKKIYGFVKQCMYEVREGMQIPEEAIQQIIKIYHQIGYRNLLSTIMKEKIGFSFELVPTEHKKQKECQFQKEFYEKRYLNPFKDFIKNYYKNKAQKWLTECDTEEYVDNCLYSFEFEERNGDYYYPFSKDLIIDILQKELILPNAEKIVTSTQGALYMLKMEKHQSLRKLYQLLKREKTTLEFLSHELLNFTVIKGNEFIAEIDFKQPAPAVSLEFIKQLFNLKRKVDSLVINQFGNDILFQSARDLAFQQIINSTQVEKSAFYLAMFIDQLIQEKIKLTKEEQEENLTQCISAVIYLYHRDVFLKSHQKFLSNRLLNFSHKNPEMDNQLLQKLQVECGKPSIAKISTMLSDMKQSETVNQQFQQYLGENKIKVDGGFNVLVLSEGCWPITFKGKCGQPQRLQGMTSSFEKYFNTLHKNRDIKWLFSHGNAELIFINKRKERYNLVISSYQLLILLAMDQLASKDGSNELKQFCDINPEEFQHNVAYLAKNKVLNIQEGIALEKLIENQFQVTYSINDDFQNKSKIIKCQPKPLAQKAKEEDMDETIKEERRLQLDATLVRIMKGRRVFKQNELIADCMKLTTLFRPQPPDIKKRIESLLEREYFKRKSDDRTVLEYCP